MRISAFRFLRKLSQPLTKVKSMGLYDLLDRPCTLLIAYPPPGAALGSDGEQVSGPVNTKTLYPIGASTRGLFIDALIHGVLLVSESRF